MTSPAPRPLGHHALALAAALAVAAVTHWLTGRQYYYAVGMGGVVALVMPHVTHWYRTRATLRAKLGANIAGIGGALAIIGLYAIRFSGLAVWPTQPRDWAGVAMLLVIIAFPLALIALLLLEIRDLTRAGSAGPDGRPAGRPY